MLLKERNRRAYCRPLLLLDARKQHDTHRDSEELSVQQIDFFLLFKLGYGSQSRHGWQKFFLFDVKLKLFRDVLDAPRLTGPMPVPIVSAGMMTQLHIERAGVADHQTLSDIAHAAKRHWGYPESWMRLWHDALTITPDYIAGNTVYVARIEDAIAGFYALLGDGARLSLDHLWLSPARIGTGIGKALFNHAVATARHLGATEVEIEADPNALGFYEHLGATRIGENRYEIEGQPRILPLLVYKLT